MFIPYHLLARADDPKLADDAAPKEDGAEAGVGEEGGIAGVKYEVIGYSVGGAILAALLLWMAWYYFIRKPKQTDQATAGGPGAKTGDAS